MTKEEFEQLSKVQQDMLSAIIIKISEVNETFPICFSNVKASDNLARDWGLDSLDMVELEQELAKVANKKFDDMKLSEDRSPFDLTIKHFLDVVLT